MSKNQENLLRKGLLFEGIVESGNKNYASFALTDSIVFIEIDNTYYGYDADFIRRLQELYIEKGRESRITYFKKDFAIITFEKGRGRKYELLNIDFGIMGSNFLRELGYYLADNSDSYKFDMEKRNVKIQVYRQQNKEEKIVADIRKKMELDEEDLRRRWLSD